MTITEVQPDLCVNGHDKNKVGTFKRSHRESLGCRACKRNTSTNSLRKYRNKGKPVVTCPVCSRSVVTLKAGIVRHLDNEGNQCSGTGRMF